MVHWTWFRALSVRGMLHSIHSQHMNRGHHWISSDSFPSYQDEFRGLFQSINWRHHQSTIIPQAYCYLPVVWGQYEKCNQTNCNTSQLWNSWYIICWDTTHSNFLSAYITIIIKSTINICCNLPWTISEGGFRHCVSSDGVSSIKTNNSKNFTLCYHQTGITIILQENVIKLHFCTVKSHIPQSWYIHPLRYHTSSTSLAQLFIQEYDYHISHLYHLVTGANDTYNYLHAQYPFKWETSFSNKIGLLAQGVGTNMENLNQELTFLTINQVPTWQKITYANPVCDYCPRKDDPYWVRLIIFCNMLP